MLFTIIGKYSSCSSDLTVSVRDTKELPCFALVPKAFSIPTLWWQNYNMHAQSGIVWDKHHLKKPGISEIGPLQVSENKLSDLQQMERRLWGGWSWSLSKSFWKWKSSLFTMWGVSRKNRISHKKPLRSLPEGDTTERTIVKNVNSGAKQKWHPANAFKRCPTAPLRCQGCCAIYKI